MNSILISIEKESLPPHTIFVLPLGFLVALVFHRNKSLSMSGAIAAFFVTAIHVLAGLSFWGMLITFFYSSSVVTKRGHEIKQTLDPEFREGGQRNWVQVLAKTGIASVLVVAIWVLTGGKDLCLNSEGSPLVTALIGGVIGHYSCCNGDTGSSESGILSDERPRLITTFKRVRRGTNGGVTKTGLLAAAYGGFSIGLSFLFGSRRSYVDPSPCNTFLKRLQVIPVATLAGLCGSIIDSLLGATLQFSGFYTIRRKVVGKPGPTVRKISGFNILDHNAVNLISILLTSFVTSIACLYIF